MHNRCDSIFTQSLALGRCVGIAITMGLNINRQLLSVNHRLKIDCIHCSR